LQGISSPIEFQLAGGNSAINVMVDRLSFKVVLVYFADLNKQLSQGLFGLLIAAFLETFDGLEMLSFEVLLFLFGLILEGRQKRLHLVDDVLQFALVSYSHVHIR
jgi:hypothetical protein